MSEDWPIGGLSAAEAAEILGVSRGHVNRLVVQGQLPRNSPQRRHGLAREDVERLALQGWKPGRPYWTDVAGAAHIMGVTPTRVRQLVIKGVLPAVCHNGRWRFRRAQLAVIANARAARFRP